MDSPVRSLSWSVLSGSLRGQLSDSYHGQSCQVAYMDSLVRQLTWTVLSDTIHTPFFRWPILPVLSGGL